MLHTCPPQDLSSASYWRQGLSIETKSYWQGATKGMLKTSCPICSSVSVFPTSPVAAPIQCCCSACLGALPQVVQLTENIPPTHLHKRAKRWLSETLHHNRYTRTAKSTQSRVTQISAFCHLLSRLRWRINSITRGKEVDIARYLHWAAAGTWRGKKQHIQATCFQIISLREFLSST